MVSAWETSVRKPRLSIVSETHAPHAPPHGVAASGHKPIGHNSEVWLGPVPPRLDSANQLLASHSKGNWNRKPYCSFHSRILGTGHRSLWETDDITFETCCKTDDIPSELYAWDMAVDGSAHGNEI